MFIQTPKMQDKCGYGEVIPLVIFPPFLTISGVSRRMRLISGALPGHMRNSIRTI